MNINILSGILLFVATFLSFSFVLIYIRVVQSRRQMKVFEYYLVLVVYLIIFLGGYAAPSMYCRYLLENGDKQIVDSCEATDYDVNVYINDKKVSEDIKLAEKLYKITYKRSNGFIYDKVTEIVPESKYNEIINKKGEDTK